MIEQECNIGSEEKNKLKIKNRSLNIYLLMIHNDVVDSFIHFLAKALRKNVLLSIMVMPKLRGVSELT